MATREEPDDRRRQPGARPPAERRRPPAPVPGEGQRRRPPPGQRPRRPQTGPDLDQPTVVFEPVKAGGVGTLERETKPAPAPLGKGGVAVRTVGELLITAGVVVLLFMVYELYVTDLFSAGKQSDASSALDNEWSNDRSLHPDLIDGQAFARIHIPSFGADFNFTIQEGTSESSLEVGPGHYKGSALPGQPGNFAVAGHRVGKGAPFNDLDNLSSCDSVVIETQTDFFIYKVLPHEDERDGWTTGRGADPKCKGVSTLQDPNAVDGGAYSKTTGREVVLPTRGDAVNPVPYVSADKTPPPASQVSLLTLTTCHPQFSAKERLIIHSVLTQQVPKTQVSGYTDLMKKIGEAS